MTQPANNRFIEIGRIGRPHGLEGTVRIVPNSVFTAYLLDQTSIVFMKNNRSDLIPVRIESIQIEEKRNQQTFFVKFDSIADRTDAEQAIGKALFIEKEKPDSLLAKQDEPVSIVGYAVDYQNREIGRVLDVLKNPAHPILEISFESGSLLIPFVDEYIEKTDHEKHTVYCQNLDQLTDL